MTFPYPRDLLTSYGNMLEEVKMQTNKVATISGALKDVVWKTKDLSITAKTRIYETNNGYSIEIRAKQKSY